MLVCHDANTPSAAAEGGVAGAYQAGAIIQTYLDGGHGLRLIWPLPWNACAAWLWQRGSAIYTAHA